MMNLPVFKFKIPSQPPADAAAGGGGLPVAGGGAAAESRVTSRDSGSDSDFKFHGRCQWQ